MKQGNILFLPRKVLVLLAPTTDLTHRFNNLAVYITVKIDGLF